MLSRTRHAVKRLMNLHKLFQVGDRLNELESQIVTLQDSVDMLKSKVEIPPELVAEFFAWKASHPIPERPLVSVCVATYNRAQLLTERCIASVLGQTYNHLELIVVGDGCTDETEEMVAKIDDPRLQFINLSNRASYPEDPWRRWMVAGALAMNKALSMANGDYVTHLDDDDEYLPDRLEKLVAFSSAHQCDFVWHPFWYEDRAGRWRLLEATHFRRGSVTNSSVFYRAWFAKIEADINSHHLLEPGDWTRFRRIRYFGPVAMRYPEPLLRHYRAREQRQ